MEKKKRKGFVFGLREKNLVKMSSNFLLGS